MDIMQVMEERHSVRQYTDRKIEGETLAALKEEISLINQSSGLDFQLVTDEPGAFTGFMPRYGKFVNVRNYIGLIGPRNPELDEQIGYWGERVVLKAQELGLNTCWVGMSFSKRRTKFHITGGEKLVCVLALGYGQTQGIAHSNRPLDQVTELTSPGTEWFKNGIKAAMLAPTAVNQQHFKISVEADGKVKIVSTGGFFSKVDLGIVKYQFEAGAGKDFPGYAK